MKGSHSAGAGVALKRDAAPVSAARGVAASRLSHGGSPKCDIGRFRAAPISRTIATVAAVLILNSITVSAVESKRVLLVHSFGGAAPPFTVHSMAFEQELAAKLGERVDLDEVSLDMARYADRDMQEALVDYLQKRQAKWKPDLVVPIGSPAAIFVANFRDRLFPETPILYTSLDRRLLPPHALEKNAAYVGQVFEIPGLIEDMLRVVPTTKNIAVIVGATPLEHYWEQAFRKAAEPLAGRINFTYFSDLSFDEMLERAATLPPDSFIFILLLLRDASGATHNADEALQRLHAVARGPINSIFDHQLGLGIVGGRLYQGQQVGKEAAQVAIRILHGEPASSFPPRLIEPHAPRYDWRELQRWKIDEKLLPPGSTVLFREPTVWERYRAWIIAGASIFILQALLITGLVANLIRRRRAESSLAESEKRFQTTADATPVLIWMTGDDQGCTFFNKAWLEFTGRSIEQELGRGWREGVHPDDRDKATQSYHDVFAAREPFTVQYRLRRNDGQYRWITDQGVPRYGPNGNFRGYVGACVDVTDLLEKDAALRESEERVALAAEAAQIGVWELNPGTQEFWASEKWHELFGFGPEEEVTYEDFRARVHPDDRSSRDALVEQAIANQGRYDTEFRVVWPDGTLRWMAGRAHCLTDGEGADCRLLGVAVDVTKRKEAEDLFQLATEASPSGTVLVNEKGRILLVNAHIEELFGYTRDELIDQQIEVLVPERFWSTHPSHLAGGAPRPSPREVGTGWEAFARRKDGSEFPVEVGLNPIDTPQGLLVLASVVDISARKAAEREVRQRREQVELLGRASLLGEMTASLAHELMQPLSAIASNANAGMLFLEKGNVEATQLHEIFQDVVADSRRAHEIVQNVRSAIKTGSALRGRINVNQIVQTVAHLVQPDALAHFCTVETSLAEGLPAVDGDPSQLQQVLINLVSNAFQAMSETPREQRKVRISTACNGEKMISVGVRDYGHGISEEAREHLFEQFFTTKQEGLGMGLAIVRSIVEAHGGKIEAENMDGGGAQFRFQLPATAEAPV